MNGLKFLQSIIDTSLIEKSTNNNVESKLESASYKSGDNIVVLEGDLKDDQITHGAKKYYKQNGAIIKKFEGQFTDNQLTSGAATYYDDNGNIKIIAEGQFDSSVLSNGTKSLYYRDNDLSQIETGTFDENGKLADGKKETFYASMQLMVLHEGKFLNSDLTQGKEYIYREDGFLYYESSGEFIKSKLAKGKRIHYREDKKIDVVFDGDFSDEVFLQGNVIKYNDEDKMAQQFNGKFNEAREIIEGKVISYNDNEEIAAINQGIFIPVCRIKQEFISQNEFNYYLIKEETTINISQNIFQALTLFFDNKDELLKKYQKGIVNLGYGKFDYAPAIKEVDYFIKIIILEQIQATAEELTSIKEYILQILQFISPDKQPA